MKIRAGLTDHIIGMRACVPPVRGFLVAGWHARTSRETGWILNGSVSAVLCAVYCEHQHRCNTPGTYEYDSRPPLCIPLWHNHVIRMCMHTCVCVYIYMIHDWFLKSPLEQILKLQDRKILCDSEPCIVSTFSLYCIYIILSNLCLVAL